MTLFIYGTIVWRYEEMAIIIVVVSFKVLYEHLNYSTKKKIESGKVSNMNM